MSIQYLENNPWSKIGEALIRGLVRHTCKEVDAQKLAPLDSMELYGCFGSVVRAMFGVSGSTIAHYRENGISIEDNNLRALN